MTELTLRTIVLRFDDQIVEIFGDRSGEVIRHHIALLHEPSLGKPDRSGRTPVPIGRSSFGVDGDELESVRSFVNEVSTAVSRARRRQDP